jgi:hypothetical protein
MGVDGGQVGGGPAGGGPGGGRSRRGRLTPLLAAAAVVVIAGASTGVAVALSSHTSKAPPAAGGSAASSSASSPAGPTQSASLQQSPQPNVSSVPITNGAWHAGVVVPNVFTPGSLIASGSHLYAFTDDNLFEVDPVKSTTVGKAPYNGFPDQAPVVAGGKIWTVATYGPGIGLVAYNPQTLAQAGTITVSASGLLTSEPDGALTSGPDGNLYVAAGSAVEKVNPANGSVLQRYAVNGSANAVAVSSDGARLYAGSVSGTQFQITEYNLASGQKLATTSEKAEIGGDMVATSGGVWFTTGNSMAEQVWFAPASNLSSSRLIAAAGNGGQDSVPTYADGVVWVGGAQRLQCLDPNTAQVRASSYITASNGTQKDIGDIAVLNGHVYAVYLTSGGATGGVALLKPPSACFA